MHGYISGFSRVWMFVEQNQKDPLPYSTIRLSFPIALKQSGFNTLLHLPGFRRRGSGTDARSWPRPAPAPRRADLTASSR